MDNYSSTNNKIHTLWNGIIDLGSSDSMLETVLTSLKGKTGITIKLKKYWWIKGLNLPHTYNSQQTFYDEYGSQQAMLAINEVGQFSYESAWINTSEFVDSNVLYLGNSVFLNKWLMVYFIAENYTASNTIDFDTEDITTLPETKFTWRLEKVNDKYYLHILNPIGITRFKFIVKYFKVK